MYTLDPDKIIATLQTLEQRIGERFPGSGLLRVSGQLTRIARAATANIARIARANVPLRAAVACLLGLAGAMIVWFVVKALDLETSTELTSIVQGVDASVSLLLVLGGAAFYLSTLESRWRRDAALAALHEFRSIVHVIDMHQLTKDPTALGAPRTSSSPERSMSKIELLRYLSYCSELLSLSGKVAALYADKLRDPVIIEAVGDIERLTTELSQKMWQKIELVEEHMHDRPPSSSLAPKIGA
ncbi:MAG: hypothetical protein K8F92_08065 [Hyphomicrobium sp.]|uniref:hypothetical protein n=1 Tax=Hyphomicrobium sp. TaxID=82 RepID=UPI0013247238|nr:hypothetical protein [Hyphomicrobium sp.]KAB2939413.1 MAG: hypothetical protein F9K20_16885 [Hyphomicrobium sp.]MBZ0209595.1 hypothetical protein [Hyphomicrobium sp.]